MNIQMNKTDLIIMIQGIVPYSSIDCNTLLNINFMKYVGNEHNEAWEWNHSVLNSLTENDLYELYLIIKESIVRKQKIEKWPDFIKTCLDKYKDDLFWWKVRREALRRHFNMPDLNPFKK